jgi:transposase
MRTPGTAAELERRRYLAVQRLRDGHTAPEVADFLGAHVRTVRSRQAAHRTSPTTGLRAKPPPGPTRKLTC